MKNNQLERYATAAFVIGSIIGTFFFSRPKRGAFRTDIADEQQRELDLNLTTPANATFGIAWPVIYTGTIGLAVHQALPSQANNPRYAKARPWLWANYVLNLVFGYFFSKSDLSSRVGGGLTTISLLPLSLGLHRQLEIGRTAVPEPENTLRKSISLYTGWLTAATVVSGANLLLQAGYRVSPATARRWAYGILSATGGLGIVVSKRLNDPYYLVTLIAAFVGIAAKQRGRNDDVAAVAAAWAVALAGVFVQRLRDAQTTAQQAPATDAADQSSESPAEPATPALVEADKG
ncbi:tryptophan-rich sensory protein [Fibrisoma montanum]|uniref:Tryptophan-rich sensory protein n=1 Tax=Fibrisoma montanum TaxID=2305895 RepID=A0A418LZQ1_9BACT|nr:tryptophan-rich sensory protein [Fibrisoma montanum]RIV18739.1 tryptophan-rich sensory protein [Fibrisoma montanum]